MASDHLPNRWVIAVAAVCLQIALGAVYAWSVFRIPLSRQFGWSISRGHADLYDLRFRAGGIGVLWRTLAESTWAANCRAYRWRSLRQRRLPGQLFRPQIVVVISNLWSNGRSGFGLRLHRASGCAGQVVPGAQRLDHGHSGRRIRRRCVDYRAGGHAPGIQPSASSLRSPTLGVAFLIVIVISGTFMQNPPDGWKPAGWNPTSSQVSQRSKRDYTLGEALGTWQWWAFCSFFCSSICRRAFP